MVYEEEEGVRGELDGFRFAWSESPDELLDEWNFAAGFVPTQLTSNGEWRMFSRSDFNGKGRVVIRNAKGDEFILEGF